MDGNRNANIRLRTNLKPDDIESIAELHRTVYGQEYGFDATFKQYVAEPLTEFVRRRSRRERLWIAERDGRIIGCVAVVAASPETAQLRWFLVEPRERGLGLGCRLLNVAIAFGRGCGYERIILWTVSALSAAAHLYRRAGFEKVEEKPGRAWGVDVIAERYELNLSSAQSQT